jgi:ribonuclease HI
MKLRVYCDGACSYNPGPGAWAYKVFDSGSEIAYAYGAFENTTNNRMELFAAIKALEAFDNVYIVLDSKYVMEGITNWIEKWKKNGWRTASGEVKNKDLWLQLSEITKFRDVTWEWQKGHALSLHDEVDFLARSACKNFQID